MTDNAARIHIAANDPAFAQKREAAVQAIAHAIAAVAIPFGYAQKGTTWARSTATGKSAVHLQRGRYGFDACINLRFVTPDGNVPESPVWQDGEDIRIDRFYLPGENPDGQNATMAYLDVIENPERLAMAIRILKNRALPWLDAHHTGLPEIAAYLPNITG